MFCKHCGKNIYDLEKCPFCNDGENLNTEQNGIGQEEGPEQIKYVHTGEFYTDKVRKKNPAYRLADISEIAFMIAIFAIMLLMAIVEWMSKDFANIDLMLYTVYTYMLPVYWMAYILSTAVLVQGIAFLYDANKNKPKTAELFEYIKNQSKEAPALAWNHDSYIGDTWKAIMYRHNKKGFYMSWSLLGIDMLKPIIYIVLGVPALKYFHAWLLVLRSDSSPDAGEYIKNLLLNDKVIIFIVAYVIVKIAGKVIENMLTKEKQAMLSNYENGKYAD
ncbi:MAG: hypothetical protein IJW54_00410 [Clostridia bacterium]|nr:hypothetical protein [Clostridia bacterium]